MENLVKECKAPKSTLKDDISEAKAIAGGKQKTIVDQSVHETVVREVAVNRPMIFFTHAEYKMTFGKNPPTGAKANVVSMPSEDSDEQEKLWYVKDEERGLRPSWLGPHRTGYITTKKVITHNHHRMNKCNHRFTSQSNRTIKHFIKKCDGPFEKEEGEITSR